MESPSARNVGASANAGAAPINPASTTTRPQREAGAVARIDASVTRIPCEEWRRARGRVHAMLPCDILPTRQAPMNSPARLVWLFDVDGTLLTTEGASREVFGRVVARRVGGREDLSDIDF